jgi:anti-sigma factor RsiW
MTCREFADFMGEYLAGDLPSAAKAEFERHLDICVNCQKYLTWYEQTVKLGKAAFRDGDASLPPEVPEPLVKAILAARARHS